VICHPVQSAKKATGKVVDATVNTAKTVGESISSTSRDLKSAAGKLTSRGEPNK
jgi:hypothetical protein